jgi:hypothetical protein
MRNDHTGLRDERGVSVVCLIDGCIFYVYYFFPELDLDLRLVFLCLFYCVFTLM